MVPLGRYASRDLHRPRFKKPVEIPRKRTERESTTFAFFDKQVACERKPIKPAQLPTRMYMHMRYGYTHTYANLSMYMHAYVDDMA